MYKRYDIFNFVLHLIVSIIVNVAHFYHVICLKMNYKNYLRYFSLEKYYVLDN